VREATVLLDDGRRLSYADRGSEDGFPLMYFHGVPGGRSLGFDPDAVAATGTRVITVERPGFGRSDPCPGRTLSDWPRDVEALAGHLGIDRFAVAGASAGAPGALACAYWMADRVTSAGIICGVGPLYDHPEFDDLLAPEFKALLPLIRQNRGAALEAVEAFIAPAAASWAADPSAFWDAWVAGLPESVQRQMVLPGVREMWEGCFASTYERGAAAVVDEVGANYSSWGFSVRDVEVPVHVWHGADDNAGSAPVEVARFVAGEARQGELVVYPGEGHFLDRRHHLDWLTALAR
jgi:pimeloyl-ACP methyl ester carboxylesterase